MTVLGETVAPDACLYTHEIPGYVADLKYYFEEDFPYSLNDPLSPFNELVSSVGSVDIENIRGELTVGSLMDIYLYGSTRDEGRLYDGAGVVASLFQSYRSVKYIERCKEMGLRPDTHPYHNAERLKASGLEFVDDENKSGRSQFGITLDSLANSLRTGSIRHLTNLTAADLDLLQGYCSEQLDEAIAIPQIEVLSATDLYLLAEHKNRTPNGVPFVDFMATAMREGRQTPYSGRHLRGPYYEKFKSLLAELNEQLLAIDPTFPEHYLHARTYLPAAVRDEIDCLDITKRKQLENLYNSKHYLMGEVAEETWEEDQGSIIEKGVLTIPPFIKQEDPKSCVNTCFRMVFAGITGNLLNDSEVSRNAAHIYGEDIIDERELLKIFTSTAYQQEYGGVVETIQFTGMSLKALTKIVTGLKKRRPDGKTFCVVNLQTESALDKNIWHANVLTQVGEEVVVAHDPSSDRYYGRRNRTIDKERFMYRWAVAYNTGYLVLAS